MDRQTGVQLECTEKDGRGMDCESYGIEPGEQRVPQVAMEGAFKASRPKRIVVFLSGNLGWSASPTPASPTPREAPGAKDSRGCPGSSSQSSDPMSELTPQLELASKDLPLVF